MSKLKIAVITGGGSYGAYHAGTLAALDLKFDEVYGTSTGALMAPLVALGEYNALKIAYTSLDQYSIFNSWLSNPIKKNGKISILKSASRIISGKKSLGATDKALKQTIRKFYPQVMHEMILNDRNVIVNAVDLLKKNSSKVEYFNAKNTPYNEFTEYMRASASFPGIMSPVYLNDMELVDGGLAEAASVLQAFKQKPEELHVFIHSIKPNERESKKSAAQNFLHMLMRILNTFMDEVKQNDLDIDKIKALAAKFEVERVYLHYMKEEFTNRLVFNKQEMAKMWDLGFEHAFDDQNNINIG